MTKKSYSEREQLISDQEIEIKRYRRMAEEYRNRLMKLVEPKGQKQRKCHFCHGDSPISLLDFSSGDVSVRGDQLVFGGWDYYFDEPDFDSKTISFCPMCGRKLAEAQHDTRTD